MSVFWTMLAGISAGIAILVIGIFITRDKDQPLREAAFSGMRWGAWFMAVFAGQAALLSHFN
ncbi:MAG: hypothetical protein ABII63_05275 [Pseudomonadota bacterium]